MRSSIIVLYASLPLPLLGGRGGAGGIVLFGVGLAAAVDTAVDTGVVTGVGTAAAAAAVTVVTGTTSVLRVVVRGTLL